MKLLILLFICIGSCVALTQHVKYCAPGDTTPGCVQCPDDHHWWDCDADPCERDAEAGCPLQKHFGNNPICISNQCGGCRDEWFLPNGTQVWCWGP